ncbi:UBP-type zinc finger domain-containing protein [Phytomonospora endophytica]|uniref:Putative UBP type Zn finger protein n=1 Tax=Phytomonospora endophytica TaxID=714109 RepID=A0A841FKZ2_9ACTN|nr:UBP-type zinc finger domain-containing protein [Phytomonospora endophytica]MBB6036575.1 putative UBP type Zn finger protein [Phytomonospora endophytica]GIG65896.1 hypothetical protein Pen01_21910 [Phytomonospora endophytica]
MNCTHLDHAGDMPLPAELFCARCVEAGQHDWVHLRMCLECGNVACCDSSSAQHATAHFKETGHPVMRSAEPGEEWRWCYVDEVLG